uniref:Ovule protein n=1 Tax=Bursaphelenchus xylophilus TaxID=6326 RepID=A0A1I7RUJ6_BURXY
MNDFRTVHPRLAFAASILTPMLYSTPTYSDYHYPVVIIVLLTLFLLSSQLPRPSHSSDRPLHPKCNFV